MIFHLSLTFENIFVFDNLNTNFNYQEISMHFKVFRFFFVLFYFDFVSQLKAKKNSIHLQKIYELLG